MASTFVFLPGESHTILLELKLLADVGLVGFPNVGKSTLLSVVSKAHPKIANYHFTTLFPNLGVVYVTEGTSFVMADIPGIIEGASDGAGLGHDFLRHIDRCRLLVHLVDVSGSEGRDPVEDFEAINAELRAYSDVLGSRMQIVAANKCDLLGDDRTNIDRLRAHVEAQGYEFFEMSAAAHTGTRELVQACAAKLAEIPPMQPYEADYVPPEPEVGTSDELQIRHFDDLWVVEGPWLQRLMGSINFGDYESRMYFDRVLRQSGLFDRLEAMGIEEGDTVILNENGELRKVLSGDWTQNCDSKNVDTTKFVNMMQAVKAGKQIDWICPFCSGTVERLEQKGGKTVIGCTSCDMRIQIEN